MNAEYVDGLSTGILTGILIGFLVCLIGLTLWAPRNLNPELIERGIKQYNQETGVLEWVEK